MGRFERVTQKDLARELGVTTATVSMALRGHPRISGETIARVKEAARRLGYRENPLLSQLMTTLQQQKKSSYTETIALLTKYSDPKMNEEPYLRALFGGMRTRADSLGYVLEEFSMKKPDMNREKVARILTNRGVRGVVVAPFRGNVRHLSFDFSRFSSVALGFRVHEPAIDCAVPDHFFNLHEITRHLVRSSYRRIGLVGEKEYYINNEFRWLGGYLVALGTGRTARVPLVLRPVALTRGIFLKWMEKEKPDAVISSVPTVLDWLQEAGLKIPSDLGYAATVCGTDKIYRQKVSGIDNHPDAIGRAAMDLLALRLNRHSRGVPEAASAMLIKGTWVDGGTLRQE